MHSLIQVVKVLAAMGLLFAAGAKASTVSKNFVNESRTSLSLNAPVVAQNFVRGL